VNRPSNKILIFIATYNEAENVEALFPQVNDLRFEGKTPDVLFLDDNSPDGTGKIIDRLAAENPNVFTIHRSGKLGIGSAHLAGIAWAYEHGYQTLVTMDCDFTHSPDRIPEFVTHAESFDIVVGSRYMQKGSLKTWNLMRKSLTHTGHLLTTNLLGMPFDATGAFRAYRLDRIPQGFFELVYSASYSFFFESLYICWLNGARIHEIAIDLPARTYGSSKMAIKDALRSTVLLVHLFVKTRIDRRAMLYAEPFTASGKLEPTTAQQEWNAYWFEKKKPGALIYDLIAAFYRKFIIKPSLNHYVGKYFESSSQVLHAGCGGGQVDSDIALKMRISALDISEQALSMYRKCQPKSEQLIHGSIFEIASADGTFDGIYNLGVMEHFTEAEISNILLEFNRVLKPGGRILLFWPPSLSVTVRVLAGAHWVLRKAGRQDIKLHPNEITHVRSRRQVKRYLADAGFTLVNFHFGYRDLFTQTVVVGQKGAVVSPKKTREAIDLGTSAIGLETGLRS
jgi:dolichol-phosphate mannosyltransferase